MVRALAAVGLSLLALGCSTSDTTTAGVSSDQAAFAEWYGGQKAETDALVATMGDIENASATSDLAALKRACTSLGYDVADVRNPDPPDSPIRDSFDDAMAEYLLASTSCLDGLDQGSVAMMQSTADHIAKGNAHMQAVNSKLDARP